MFSLALRRIMQFIFICIDIPVTIQLSTQFRKVDGNNSFHGGKASTNKLTEDIT